MCKWLMLLDVLECLPSATGRSRVEGDLLALVKFFPCMGESFMSLTCRSGVSESLSALLVSQI
jgi:hypothetical protein